MKLGLRGKLFGSFGLILALMFAVSVLGVRLGSQTYAQMEDIGNRQLHKVEAGGQIQNKFADVRRYQIQVVNLSMMNNKQKAAEYAKQVDEIFTEVKKLSTEWGNSFQTTEGKQRLAAFNEELNKYIELDKETRTLINQGKFNEAMKMNDGEGKQSFDATLSKLDAVMTIVNEYVDGVMSDAEKSYQTTKQLTVAVTIVAIILGAAIAFLISNSIIKVVNQMLYMLKDMAQSGGDLTKRIEVQSKDEIGELALSFNSFLDKLHDVIAQVRQSAEALSSAANETSLGNQDLSQRTEEQASSLQEISSTIEEVSASLQKSSDNANQADGTSNRTMQTVRKGETVVAELNKAMEEITRGSHEIAEIIAKVNDIAFQTNLLALNAAVEAARAGEQGRGFAVVAAEVRNLAGRTAESAKEIEGLIKESINKVERGNQLMNETSSVLDDIVDNTQTTTEVIVEIASSMREQANAAHDIRSAVEQLNQVTQQNASLVEEIAGSSESVSNEAEELAHLVGKFKLKETAYHSAAPVTNQKARFSQPSNNSNVYSMVAASGEPSYRDEDFEKF